MWSTMSAYCSKVIPRAALLLNCDLESQRSLYGSASHSDFRENQNHKKHSLCVRNAKSDVSKASLFGIPHVFIPIPKSPDFA